MKETETHESTPGRKQGEEFNRNETLGPRDRTVFRKCVQETETLPKKGDGKEDGEEIRSLSKTYIYTSI